MAGSSAVETIHTIGLAPGALWQPISGEETEALLNHKGFDDAAKVLVREEAGRILSRCLPPTTTEQHRTGLVVGYVQSGKTLSFTTVTAMARDNGYRLIIVVAGTKTNLVGQSTERLENDLRLSSRDDRAWRTEVNPSLNSVDIGALQGTLDAWNRPINQSRKKTILITVMKNVRHLENLAEVLARLNLDSVPALIIDDEADQAGLNNRVRQNEESTTYQMLTGLRQVVPHHTYLSYTATPQALLLIARIDALSPDFTEVLTPGAQYTGGQDFFRPGSNLVHTIPVADIPSDTNPIHEPPESLLRAMRLFFLGVAAGYITDGGRGNRTMMVHPSQLRDDHATYARWVHEVQREWRSTLSLPDDDPDRIDLLAEFQPAFAELQTTAADLPSFDELIEELPNSIGDCDVIELNTRRGRLPEIDWRNCYATIIVGGNAMDRGFTVEGLTVSYMPRGIGGGNVDTLQQRARFFGYKRRYLGYCRIFLEAQSRRAFEAYVNHEEHMRSALRAQAHSGLPLSQWRRQFFLSPQLQPTRASVLSLPIMRGNVAGQWYFPRVPHDTPEGVINNRGVVEEFFQERGSEFAEAPGDPRRTPAQRHQLLSGAQLRDVYENLLVPLHFTAPRDSTTYSGALLQIERYLNTDPDALVDVYDMAGPEQRFRNLNSDSEISNPFQGSNAATGYPGARRIRSDDRLTVQIYRLDLGGREDSPQFEDVPLVAMYVPTSFSNAWIIERA